MRIAGLAAGIAVLSACGTVRAAALPQELSAPDRVLVVRAGVPVDDPLTDLAVAGDVDATLQLAPTETRHERVLTLTLRQRGGAVLDATVEVVGRMRFMDHGSFRVAGTAAGDGRYVAVLPLAMPGEWRLAIDVATGRDSGEIGIDLDTFD